MSLIKYIGAALVGAAAVLIGTSPSGVTPPTVPPGSTTVFLPPWPIFRVAISLNEFFEAAAWATRPPPVQVKSLATAYWQSEIAYSLTKNGIIDAIGEKGGVDCADVAKSLGLVEDFLCRMMRAGEGIKLLTTADGKFSLTPAGDMLRADHPGSLRSFMLMINEESKDSWRAAGTTSLTSGVSGFKEHFKSEFWDWHSKASRSRQMAQFDGAMKSFSADIAGSLLVDWAPPAPDAVVCDVGGGVGHMLIAMAQHYPALKGVVSDLPPVATRATANIASQGLEGRLSAVGASFFDELPSELAQCDAFYLKFILHDWSDADNVSLLKRIREVAKPGAKLVTTDFILGSDGAAMEMNKKMMDVNMMASNPAGARERTVDEYFSLFSAAGIQAEPKLIKMRDLVSTVEVSL